MTTARRAAGEQIGRPQAPRPGGIGELKYGAQGNLAVILGAREERAPMDAVES